MNKKVFPLILFALAIIFIQIASAAENEKPLMNADVVELLKSGLPESVVVSKIESSKANFDLSKDALIDLKKQGLGEKVLNAMLKASTPRQAVKSTSEDVTLVADSAHLEVALIEDGKRTVMTKGGYFKMSGSYNPFNPGARGKVKFDGPRAAFRVKNSTPVFEVTIPVDVRVGENVMLVLPKVEKDEREVEVMRSDIAGQRKGKMKTVNIVTEQVRTQGGLGTKFVTYRVQPATTLATGEYVLMVRDGSVHNQMGGNYYDFGLEAGE